MQYRTYDTGDQLWVRRNVDGKEVTVKFITHDGCAWEEGQESNRQLVGAEKFLHTLVVAAIRFQHWIMNL